MKKIIKSICILSIILLFIFLSKEEEGISNRVYHNNNITINYPYFNNKKMDNYIEEFIINSTSTRNTFIDYDYNLIDNNYHVNFYIYKFNNNITSYQEKCFCINTNNNQITEEKSILNNYNYLNKNIYNGYKLIALTFDDGPSHNTSRLLDILNKYQVKATFFLVGTNINNEKEVIKKMDKSGMEIGNHTYSHKILSRQKQENIKLEIDKTNDLIYSITGKYPTLFRPSYGQTSKKIRKSSNMPIIIWNIDTLDWKYHSSDRIVNSILSKVKEGDIILMHDLYTSSVNAIDKLIPKLLENGYMPVTVSELFYYHNIELKEGKVYSHAR